MLSPVDSIFIYIKKLAIAIVALLMGFDAFAHSGEIKKDLFTPKTNNSLSPDQIDTKKYVAVFYPCGGRRNDKDA